MEDKTRVSTLKANIYTATYIIQLIVKAKESTPPRPGIPIFVSSQLLLVTPRAIPRAIPIKVIVQAHVSTSNPGSGI